MRRYAAILLCVLSTMAARPQCDERASFQMCGEMTVFVQPGECVELTIDCDPEWAALGSFTVCDTFEGLWVEIERRPGVNTVRLCAADDTVIPTEEIEFLYVTADGAVFVGIVTVTVDELLSAQATADPSVVVSGGSAQLDVDVSGGTPPYSFIWGYSDAFVGPYDIRNPVVKPSEGEILGVVVRDSGGQRMTTSVLVDVIPNTNVVAVPDTIDAGESVSLFFGTSPPFLGGSVVGWTWSPFILSGDPADRFDPSTTATPQVTTTYTYSLRTFYGTVFSDSVTVYVRP